MNNQKIIDIVSSFAAQKKEAPLYPGATRVLSGTKDMSGLDAWRDRIGHDEADTILKESHLFGHSLDKLVDWHFSDPNFNIDDWKQEPGFKLYHQLAPHLKDIQSVATQLTVWSDHVKVKGIMDIFGFYKDIPTVIDIKNSLKPKKPEYIEDYFLQCTMYSMLMHDLLGVDIKQIALLVAVRPGKYHLALPQVFIRSTKDYIRPALKRIKEYHATHDYLKEKGLK